MNSPAGTIQACLECGVVRSPQAAERDEAERLLGHAWTIGQSCAFGARLFVAAGLLGLWTMIADAAFSFGSPSLMGYVILGMVSAGVLQVLLTHVRRRVLGILLSGVGLIAWTALVAVMVRHSVSGSLWGALIGMAGASLLGLGLGILVHGVIWRWVAMHGRARELGVSMNTSLEEPAGPAWVWAGLGLRRRRFCGSCGESMDPLPAKACAACGGQYVRCNCGASHDTGRWREVLERGALRAERGLAFVLVALRSTGLMVILGSLMMMGTRMSARRANEVTLMLVLMFLLQMLAGVGTGLMVVHLKSRFRALVFAALLAAGAVVGAWIERLMNGAASLPFLSWQISYGPNLLPQMGVAALGVVAGCAISLLVVTGIGRWLLPQAMQSHLLPARNTREEGAEA